MSPSNYFPFHHVDSAQLRPWQSLTLCDAICMLFNQVVYISFSCFSTYAQVNFTFIYTNQKQLYPSSCLPNSFFSAHIRACGKQANIGMWWTTRIGSWCVENMSWSVGGHNTNKFAIWMPCMKCAPDLPLSSPISFSLQIFACGKEQWLQCVFGLWSAS